MPVDITYEVPLSYFVRYDNESLAKTPELDWFVKIIDISEARDHYVENVAYIHAGYTSTAAVVQVFPEHGRVIDEFELPLISLDPDAIIHPRFHSFARLHGLDATALLCGLVDAKPDMSAYPF